MFPEEKRKEIEVDKAPESISPYVKKKEQRTPARNPQGRLHYCV